MKEPLPCITCVATSQLRSSSHCSKTLTQLNGQTIPNCYVQIRTISQAERNFLTCPTYNLGMFEVCETCPLECKENKKKKSPLEDLLKLVAPLFGLDKNKQDMFKDATDKLAGEEFNAVRNSLEVVSGTIKDLMDGKTSDISKKKLEVEAERLKAHFDGLIKDGKISQQEVNKWRSEISGLESLKVVKSFLEEKVKDDK